MAWILAKPFVTSVIIGAKRVDQLQQNLSAVDLQLTEDELQKLDALRSSRAINDEEYARAKPLSFALWTFGVGFALGWKLKPW